MRVDGRANDQLRPTKISPGVLAHAEGSALIEMGKTQVLCAVTVEDRVPQHLRGTGRGWVTAEYGMLPRSTLERTPREVQQGRPSGRTQEIQRLIGRSLRAVTRLEALGERTFLVDCDVIQADGGTRTASITGAYVALSQAMHLLVKRGQLKALPLRCGVAAVSVGVVGGQEFLDLCYEEDSLAEVDFNVVMTSEGLFVELQGTAETAPFPKERLDALLHLAVKGIQQLYQEQQKATALLDKSPSL
jgi:ribonuclease PH